MLKPLSTIVFAVGVLLTAPLVTADDMVVPPDLSAAEKRIYEALDKPARLDCIDTPLSDVLDGLRNEYGITVLLDKRALEDLGFDGSEPVTVDLQGISLRSALRLMLHDLELTYTIKDEVLLITSIDEASVQLSLRVYPVGDLVERHFADDGKTAVYDFKNLIDVVIGTVHPDAWYENGGPGSIKELKNGGLLVVMQTDEVHEEIATLLARIRAVKETNGEQQAATQTDPATVVTRSYWLTVPFDDRQATLKELRPRVDSIVLAGWAEGDEEYAVYLADRIVVRHRRDVQATLQQLLLSDLGVCSLEPPGEGGLAGLGGSGFGSGIGVGGGFGGGFGGGVGESDRNER